MSGIFRGRGKGGVMVSAVWDREGVMGSEAYFDEVELYLSIL